MTEREITIGDKSYTLKEIKYKDIASLADKESKADSAKSIMLAGCNITEEEYDNLSMKGGIELQKAINELNGLNGDDFQEPLKA